MYSKIIGYFLRFQTKKFILKVNKSEITSEIAFNGDLLEFKANHESNKAENFHFEVFLQICCPCFNP